MFVDLQINLQAEVSVSRRATATEGVACVSDFRGKTVIMRPAMELEKHDPGQESHERIY